MARLVGVDLPKSKPLEIGLTYIFGIGRTTAQKICAETGVDPRTRVSDLQDDDIRKLRENINANYKVEGALKAEVNMNIKRLIDIGSYRGLRHKMGLPARGQRTSTNARTRKGRRRSATKRK
ncbi:MAG: 30S ribosomal protein S13 [Calditrichaeota bacterium]|nr:30S ribosomal protein S13 [Calditrichota bacterium]HQU72404.1 30S ribosomal protein S13 [Calditrichia bacterium]